MKKVPFLWALLALSLTILVLTTLPVFAAPAPAFSTMAFGLGSGGCPDTVVITSVGNIAQSGDNVFYLVSTNAPGPLPIVVTNGENLRFKKDLLTSSSSMQLYNINLRNLVFSETLAPDGAHFISNTLATNKPAEL